MITFIPFVLSKEKENWFKDSTISNESWLKYLWLNVILKNIMEFSCYLGYILNTRMLHYYI